MFYVVYEELLSVNGYAYVLQTSVIRILKLVAAGVLDFAYVFQV